MTRTGTAIQGSPHQTAGSSGVGTGHSPSTSRRTTTSPGGHPITTDGRLRGARA